MVVQGREAAASTMPNAVGKTKAKTIAGAGLVAGWTGFGSGIAAAVVPPGPAASGTQGGCFVFDLQTRGLRTTEAEQLCLFERASGFSCRKCCELRSDALARPTRAGEKE